MMWTCVEYERWLDDGRPNEDRGAAEAHVAGCGRCSAALAAARSVEEGLALPPTATAPAGFTDAVMRRVSSEHVAADGSTLLWWVRVAADPAAVSLVVVAVLLVWLLPTLWVFVIGLSRWLVAWGDRTERWLGAASAIELPVAPSVLARPELLLALTFVAAPLLLWLSWQLARWSEETVAGPLVRPR
jgi:hypothetical protein